MELGNQHRLDWVDAAKGIGIILVVVGHTMRGLATSGIIEWSASAQFFDAWIYSFHMPLFFFLSGLFLFRSATKVPLLDFTSDKIRAIAYPYIVWSIIWVLLKTSLGQIPNRSLSFSDLLVIPVNPVEQYWFLYALFVVVLFLGALFALGLRPWTAVVLALLAYPGVIPVSPGWSVLYDARLFAIYVALGAFLGTNYLKDKPGISNSSVLALTAILGLALPGLVIWFGREQGWDVALALSGTAGVIAASVLLQRFNAAGVISFLGQRSLEIYVVHTIASAAGRTMLRHFHIQSPAIHIIGGIVAGLGIPLVISYCFKLIRFRYGFAFPKREPTPNDHVWHKTSRHPFFARTVEGESVIRFGQLWRRWRNEK